MPRSVRVATPEQLREQLDRFEREHAMSSRDFLRRWDAGELVERPEYFRWAGVCHLAAKMGLLTPGPGREHAVR